MARITRIVVPGTRVSIGPFAAVKAGANDYEVGINEGDSADDIAAAISSVKRRQAKELDAAITEGVATLARLPAPPPPPPGQGGNRQPYRDYKSGPHTKPNGEPFTPGSQVAAGHRRCKDCERPMSADGWDYSNRKHGAPYCIDHDPSRRGGR